MLCNHKSDLSCLTPAVPFTTCMISANQFSSLSFICKMEGRVGVPTLQDCYSLNESKLGLAAWPTSGMQKDDPAAPF